MKNDWREYFQGKELEQNFKIIEAGGDPNEVESISGSDSEPEADLFLEDENPEIFGKKKLDKEKVCEEEKTKENTKDNKK